MLRYFVCCFYVGVFFHIFFPPHVLWSCVCVNIANRCSHLFHFVLLLYFFKPTELKRFCCFPFWSLLKDANWKAFPGGRGSELYWFPIHSSNLFIRDLCYHTPINQNPGMVEAPGNQFVVEWILQQQAPLIARSNKLKPFRALGSDSNNRISFVEQRQTWILSGIHLTLYRSRRDGSVCGLNASITLNISKIILVGVWASSPSWDKYSGNGLFLWKRFVPGKAYVAYRWKHGDCWTKFDFSVLFQFSVALIKIYVWFLFTKITLKLPNDIQIFMQI